MQQQINNFLLKQVKKNLGSECTFLSFSTNEKYFEEKTGKFELTKKAIKAIMKNKLGSKDIVIIPIEEELKVENFTEIQNALKNREYEKGSGDSI